MASKRLGPLHRIGRGALGRGCGREGSGAPPLPRTAVISTRLRVPEEGGHLGHRAVRLELGNELAAGLRIAAAPGHQAAQLQRLRLHLLAALVQRAVAAARLAKLTLEPLGEAVADRAGHAPERGAELHGIALAHSVRIVAIAGRQRHREGLHPACAGRPARPRCAGHGRNTADSFQEGKTNFTLQRANASIVRSSPLQSFRLPEPWPNQ